MSSDLRVSFLLDDILNSGKKIEQYIDGLSKDTFLEDEKTIDAVVRNLEIIGEAANRIPATYREQHSSIPWHRIIGLRHRIVHDYLGIDNELIWEIVSTNLRELIARIQDVRDQFNK